MASSFPTDFQEKQYVDSYPADLACRGIRLSNAETRQNESETYLQYQLGLPTGGKMSGRQAQYESKLKRNQWTDHDHSEPGNQPWNTDCYNAKQTISGNHIHSNRYDIFNRSFSHPDDRSVEFINERASLERALATNRYFSQPQRREDINKAIHEELMNNPWGTYRRTPKKYDRYAMYIPSREKNGIPFQDRGNNSKMDMRLRDHREDIWDKYDCTGSVYATYRRAPRTFPRLDVAVNRRAKTAVPKGMFNEGATRDTRRDGLVLSNLSKIPNDAFHSINNSLMNRHNEHQTLEKQDSVQHLFSVRLNDVELMNKARNELCGKQINQNGILNKRINNNLSDDESLNVVLKRKSHDSRKSMVTDTSRKDGDKKPFFYCRWVTEFPKTLFLLTLGGHILIALVTVVLLFTSYDLFPTEFEFLPMYDLKVPWLKRDFAWRFRHEYKARYIRKWYIQGLNKWYRSMAYDRANLVIYYDTGGGNIFTKDNLKRMESVENELANMRNYSDFCVQSILLKCKKLTSVLRYFDGTHVDIDPVFNDTDYDNIAEVLYTAKTNNATKGDFAYFLTKDYHVTRKHAFAQRTRTLVPMGFPLKLGQTREAMEHEMEKFLVTNFNPTIKKLQESTPGLELIYWSFLLFKHDIVIQIFYDMILAVGSITFIFGFIVYHTKSMWISTFAVASILTSFLCTNIIYRVVIDFRYFGFFHVITLFIILGIGADDLFVFLDVWKSTEFETYPSLAHRLSSAYERSMKSMFFTSLTTTVAFFVSAFSPLLATKSFGVFAGLLVIVNYLSVVVYFPTVVILHHLYFKTWEWPCLSYISKRISDFKGVKFERKENVQKENKATTNTLQTIFDDNSVIGTAGNRYNVVGTTNAAFNHDIEDEYGFIKFTTKSNSPQRSVRGETAVKRDSFDSGVTSNTSWHTSEGQKQKKLLVRFFRDYYFKFVTHWLIKWIILIILTTLVVFFTYCISTLETENEPAQFYRNSHNYGKALDLDFHGFVANKNDRNVVVYVVWGLKERDMSACHFSDARCIGVERFDDSFNPNTEEAQLAIKKFCEKLHSFDDLDIDHFKIRRDFSTGKPEIKCFATDMDRWLQKEATKSGENLTLPWNYRKTITFMKSRNLMYNTIKFNESFPNIYEIPVSYWLNDGYRFKDRGTFDEFQSLIGEATSYYSTPLKTDFSVFYGNRLMYLGVQVNLTLGRFSSGYPEGKPVMDRWETFVKNEVDAMPPGMQNGFQLTKDYWHNLYVQKTLEDSAIAGVLVGILLAFPILTFATQNLVIGFFATLSIGCSTICVVGILPLAGCKLGVLEALNMCMVVGLTVDYVVHLAEGYHMSKRKDRKSRVQDMLEVMGISVFSGACTTLGASVFMFFAQIQFIIRFGMFMFSTIGFSLLYSLAFFTTIMGILGPNDDNGDIKVIFHYIANKCRKVKRKT